PALHWRFSGRDLRCIGASQVMGSGLKLQTHTCASTCVLHNLIGETQISSRCTGLGPRQTCISWDGSCETR
ncbi:hypothetical protein HAX54_044344, partial [Datura stramonium]|nr:hypothetical protein [Datura stramonium]